MGLGSLGFKKVLGTGLSSVVDRFVPGAGSFVSGAVGLDSDTMDAKIQAELNEKAANKAFARNLSMWNLQNSYNDPSAQMERLQAAGLNPNLVYGGGNVTGNTSGSAPEYNLDGTKYSNSSLQRQQLALAMKEHQQRITNQAIENDLARQRLVLSERAADRDDRLADAQVAAYISLIGLRDYQQHKPGPISQGIRDVEQAVSGYSQQIKNFVDKVVDWTYPTKKVDYGKKYTGSKDFRIIRLRK